MQNKIIEVCRTAITVSFTALYVTCVGTLGYTLYSLVKASREAQKKAKEEQKEDE